MAEVKPFEAIKIGTLIIGAVHNLALFYRMSERSSFNIISLKHELYGVHRAIITGPREDFESYITINSSLGNVIFPLTAGASADERMYQTMIVSGIQEK